MRAVLQAAQLTVPQLEQCLKFKGVSPEKIALPSLPSPRSSNSALAIPSSGSDLCLFFCSSVRYNTLRYLKCLNQILPGFKVKVKDRLMLGNILLFDLLCRTSC